MRSKGLGCGWIQQLLDARGVNAQTVGGLNQQPPAGTQEPAFKFKQSYRPFGWVGIDCTSCPSRFITARAERHIRMGSYIDIFSGYLRQGVPVRPESPDNSSTHTFPPP